MNTLALQGGGILGYQQSIILTELEKRAAKLCWQLFGMIGGTSVGSIIGAGLSIGIPAFQIQSFFTIDAPVIFKSSLLNILEELWGTKYSATNIESCLKTMLGTATLRDCKTKFIATAYDVTSDRPVYFRSYEGSWADENVIVIGNDSDIMLWQVCRASSAAQTYFPAFQFTESKLNNLEMVLMDGGNTGDNAPDLLVYSEALQFTQDQIRMLSLGTGNCKWNINSGAMINAGIARAGLETIKILFSVGVDSQIEKARKILAPNHFHISPDLGDGIAIDDASSGSLNKMRDAVSLEIIENSAALNEFVS